jgi:hypothetical protein
MQKDLLVLIWIRIGCVREYIARSVEGVAVAVFAPCPPDENVCLSRISYLVKCERGLICPKRKSGADQVSLGIPINFSSSVDKIIRDAGFSPLRDGAKFCDGCIILSRVWQVVVAKTCLGSGRWGER